MFRKFFSWKKLKSFADKYQYEFEIVQALCYVMWSEKTRGMYQERQISEEVFWNSMSDLRSQLLDQESSYGRVGLSSAGWFWRFLRLDRIKLGRFEYEIDGCHFSRLKQWRGVPLPGGRQRYAAHSLWGEHDRGKEDRLL